MIEQVQNSILKKRINVFDQTLINMFNDHQTKAGHPLQVKLKRNTYDRYQNVWKKLMCFIFRLRLHPSQKPGFHLSYRFTECQRKAFTRSLRIGRQLFQNSALELRRTLTAQLDVILLRFSIALLDDQLRGSLYDSYVVGFLAVLGISIDDV